MHQIMNKYPYNIHVLWGCSILVLFFTCGYTVRAEGPTASISILHDPMTYFVPGNRMLISATIKHPAGIIDARCYFKEESQADFAFVSMEPSAKGFYQGILPATSRWTTSINYSILAVTGENAVFKTAIFTVTATTRENPELPAWQQVDHKTPLLVKTELEDPPISIYGFTDSITVDAVESTLRFAGTGVIVGGTTTEAAAINTYWTQEFAKTAVKKLWYQHWWVWAGVAAVAGTTAAVINGSGNDSKSEPSGPGSVSVTW